MLITDRYATAIRSSNLAVDERTTYSDTDVLGAYGLASRKYPLAGALERLFMGGNGAAAEVVELLTEMAWKKARGLGVKLNKVEAADMARACLAWHRDGTCKSCGGHGVLVIPGTLTLGSNECKACKGTTKRPFEISFPVARRELARWLVAEIGREQSRAGPEALKKIAPRLDF